MLHFKQRLFPLFWGCKLHIQKTPPGHIIGKTSIIQFFRAASQNILSVPENGISVAYLKYLIQLMAYKENGQSLPLQPKDRLKQRLYFPFCKRRGRLVHN